MAGHRHIFTVHLRTLISEKLFHVSAPHIDIVFGLVSIEANVHSPHVVVVFAIA